MEEARALLALEADAERVLQRRAHRRERGRVARRLDPGQPVAGVGGEQPRQVLGLRQRGPVRQCAGQVFAEAGPGRPGKCARRFQFAPEAVRAVREAEGFELRRAARRVLAHQHEIARVGHEHQPIAFPIAAGLTALRREPGIVVRRLHLDHAAFRYLAFARLALLHLLRRVESEVGMARALVGEFADAEHLRPERRADGVQQVGERPVARPLPGRAAGRAHPPEIGEIRFDRRRQPCVRSRHRPCSGLSLPGVQALARRSAPAAKRGCACHSLSSGRPKPVRWARHDGWSVPQSVMAGQGPGHPRT